MRSSLVDWIRDTKYGAIILIIVVYAIILWVAWENIIGGINRLRSLF